MACAGKREARARAIELLRAVKIVDPEKRVDDYPHQLSGGMRQRVMLAVALACKPPLVIADEPTTALDVTVQAQILDLLREMKRTFDLSLLLITHDLGVIAEVADRVAVMYAGRIVEEGPVRAIFRSPAHPYTRGLLASIPHGRAGERLVAIEGVVPNLAALPPGCAFAPRCAERLPDCDRVVPPEVEVAVGHRARCLLHAAAADRLGARLVSGPLVEVRDLDQALPARRRPVHPRLGGEGGGRRELRHRRGRNLRAGRRIGQRQEHDRPLHAAAGRTDLRRGPLPGRGRPRASRARECGRRAVTCR